MDFKFKKNFNYDNFINIIKDIDLIQDEIKKLNKNDENILNKIKNKIPETFFDDIYNRQIYYLIKEENNKNNNKNKLDNHEIINIEIKKNKNLNKPQKYFINIELIDSKIFNNLNYNNEKELSKDCKYYIQDNKLIMKYENVTDLNVFYIGYINDENTFIIEYIIDCIHISEINLLFENKNLLYYIKNNKEQNNFGYYYIYKDIKNKNELIGNCYKLEPNKKKELLNKEQDKKDINISLNENEIKNILNNNIKILLELYKYNYDLNNEINT